MNTNRSADAAETAYLTPSVESITEFAVDTGGFKAEFGQAGGGVITFVSKSGTNEFHGTAYEFLRNDDFDARSFFAPTRSIYKQSDFGASAGGPVIIPKLYHGQEQDVLLRVLRRLPQPARRERQHPDCAHAGDVPGGFFELGEFEGRADSDLRSGDHAGQPDGSGFIRDPFPGTSSRCRASARSRSRSFLMRKAVVPNRPGIVPGTPGMSETTT